MKSQSRGHEKNNALGSLAATYQGIDKKVDSSIIEKTEDVNKILPPSLPQVWAEFLDNPAFEWSLYGHFTFRDVVNVSDGIARHVHPESAGKTWDKFIHNLNRKVFGCRYYKRSGEGVTWARASEYQVRGAIHYHALIGRVPQQIKRLELVDQWFSAAGIARIYEYVPNLGAEHYLSKCCYAWKKGEVDLGGPMVELTQGGHVQQRL